MCATEINFARQHANVTGGNKFMKIRWRKKLNSPGRLPNGRRKIRQCVRFIKNRPDDSGSFGLGQVYASGRYDETMTPTTGKKRRTGKRGLVVRKPVLLFGRSCINLFFAATIIRLAGKAGQQQDVYR
jgi:hypothetical protein